MMNCHVLCLCVQTDIHQSDHHGKPPAFWGEYNCVSGTRVGRSFANKLAVGVSEIISLYVHLISGSLKLYVHMEGCKISVGSLSEDVLNRLAKMLDNATCGWRQLASAASEQPSLRCRWVIEGTTLKAIGGYSSIYVNYSLNTFNLTTYCITRILFNNNATGAKVKGLDYTLLISHWGNAHVTAVKWQNRYTTQSKWNKKL